MEKVVLHLIMLASVQEITNRFVYGEFLTETVDETPVSVFFS